MKIRHCIIRNLKRILLKDLYDQKLKIGTYIGNNAIIVVQ